MLARFSCPARPFPLPPSMKRPWTRRTLPGRPRRPRKRCSRTCFENFWHELWVLKCLARAAVHVQDSNNRLGKIERCNKGFSQQELEFGGCAFLSKSGDIHEKNKSILNILDMPSPAK